MYQPLGKLDDPGIEEGDEVFLGFRSRTQPAALPTGIARYLENMRCDRGTARPRAGCKAIATDLTLSSPPVVLDFVLPTEKAVTSITRVATTATVTTTAAHGWTTGDVVAIFGATGSDAAYYNGDFTVTVTGASTFTYTMTGTPGASAAGTIVAAKGLRIFELYDDLVRGSCVYATDGNIEGVVMATSERAWVYRDGHAITSIAYPAGETVASTDDCDLLQFLDKVYLFRGYQTADAISITGITWALNVATVTKVAHGLAVDTWVDLQGAAEAGYNGIFKIASVPTADTFTYAAPSASVTPATGTITARPCKPAMSWDRNLANAFVVVPTGYHATGGTTIRMPAASWAADFTRRLVLPYSRTEIILSDFGDVATYDKQYGELRIRPGGVDWLVGVNPYQALRLLVQYRKSVHVVELDSNSLAPVSVKEITRAFGCVARKSIANCGEVILWLSDLGVTGVQIADQLNLVPLKLPLSDQINDQIASINWPYAEGAVGLYWNNRYYLAVPTGTATRNNTLLIFNFLNKEWESVDTFQGDFDIQNFHLLDYQGQKRLHAGTSFGFLFLMEELEFDEWGNSASSIGSYDITGVQSLRDFQLGTRERKRFTRCRINANVAVGDAFNVTFVASNPDSRTLLIAYAAAETTDINLALRVPGVRGSMGTIEIETTAGRPEIRSVSLEATTADRANSVRK